MALLLAADVFGHHFDAHLHGRGAGVIDAGQKRDQFAHVDRLAKHDLVHTDGHHITRRIPAGAGVGHLVQKLQDRAAMHIAGEVGHVRRHQHSHAEFMRGGVDHGEFQVLKKVC